MKNRDYLELINGYQTPLSRREAIFQAIYLIKSESYESALLIINNYQIQNEELSFFKLKDKDLLNLLEYAKKRKI